ncbi:helix-turn-helix domain-containing protein, partial [Escherichia coli]|nr:helix-turn-helix domain-containing protein [Escherichia coli]
GVLKKHPFCGAFLVFWGFKFLSIKSGLAVAKARGKRLGRQAGVRPKSDRLLPKVVAMRAEGRSYRWIARELGISKNTVADIVQRHRANA